MKNTVAAATSAMENVQKAVKQASDMAESSFHTMANNVGAAGKTAGRKR
jgi:hypothetical protein